MTIGGMSTGSDSAAAAAVRKSEFRRAALANRAAVSPERRAAEAAALRAHLTRPVAPIARAGQVGTVAAYAPMGDEPGSIEMLDALAQLGAEVLLPLTGPPGPLDWARYNGPEQLKRAKYGLLEPIGPALGPEALGRADVIVLPALAVDRHGARLGRGAGYYDRSLPFAAPGALLAAVVRDEEILDALPEEAHDWRVSWALTPDQGWVRLGEP